MSFRRLSIFLILVLLQQPARAGVGLIPPVDGPIARGFSAPSSTFGPGHRGIDYGIPQGSTVRAAGAGIVTFAGAVAGVQAITIDHDAGIETTYSALEDVSVSVGDEVATGQAIGRVGVAHPGAEAGLHLGVKVDGEYVDPEGFLIRTDVSGAIRLVPDAVELPADLAGIFTVPSGHLPRKEACSNRQDLPRAALPPNDNVVVTVGGINSSSTNSELFEYGPELLGYPVRSIYRFSYAGHDGPDLHRPYLPQQTWGDIRVAAQRLGGLLREVHRLHPGKKVDILAHSQGGLVARALVDLAGPDATLPPIAHLVTFSSPHEGVALAGEAVEMQRARGLPRTVAMLASRVARKHPLFPDPTVPAVAQMAPGSPLIEELAAAPAAFGTRYLALAIPNDLIVPADRAQVEHGVDRVVAPAGAVTAHGRIVASHEARGLVYDFLRDIPAACTGFWDQWGPLSGTVISTGESLLTEVLGSL